MDTAPLVIVVDDEQANVDLIARIIGDTYVVRTFTDPHEAFDAIVARDPAAVIVGVLAIAYATVLVWFGLRPRLGVAAWDFFNRWVLVAAATGPVFLGGVLWWLLKPIREAIILWRKHSDSTLATLQPGRPQSAASTVRLCLFILDRRRAHPAGQCLGPAGGKTTHHDAGPPITAAINPRSH